jgi:hypothetical protein
VAGRTEGNAVASLVLGIVGVMFFFFPVIGLIPAVLALFLSSTARKRLAADPSLEGRGLATAGRVLGWVGVGIGILWLAIVIVAS